MTQNLKITLIKEKKLPLENISDKLVYSNNVWNERLIIPFNLAANEPLVTKCDLTKSLSNFLVNSFRVRVRERGRKKSRYVIAQTWGMA